MMLIEPTRGLKMFYSIGRPVFFLPEVNEHFFEISIFFSFLSFFLSFVVVNVEQTFFRKKNFVSLEMMRRPGLPDGIFSNQISPLG
jgi:hypothetical protein